MTDASPVFAIVAENVPDVSDEVPPTVEEDTCTERNVKGVRCLKEPGHEGRHRYKPRADGTSPGKSRSGGTNANLATQAADTVMQLKTFVMMGALGFGFMRTAHQMASVADAQHDRIYNALLTDPAMCRMIIRGGVKSGKLAFLVAEGLWIAEIAPVFKQELDERRAGLNGG